MCVGVCVDRCDSLTSLVAVSGFETPWQQRNEEILHGDYRISCEVIYAVSSSKLIGHHVQPRLRYFTVMTF